MKTPKPSHPLGRLNRVLQPWTTPLQPTDLLRTFVTGTAPARPRTTHDVDPTPDPRGVPAGASPIVHWGDATLIASGDDTILELLERNGEHPAVGCRRGVCRRCVTPLTSGRVRDHREERDVDAGTHVRICVSAPVTDVSLEPTVSADRVPAGAAAGGPR
jgi:ferredoxin